MRAQLQQATLLMAPRADEALDHANAYSYIPTFIIHPHIMHGRSEVKAKTTTTQLNQRCLADLICGSN